MIGFIGGGNMAEALIKGMTSKGRKDIIASEPNKDRRDYLKHTYKINTSGKNTEAASTSDIVILAVKPQIMSSVLDEIKDAINDNKTVASIAAGISISYLSERLNTKKIIRVMPNTPSLVQEGMSVLSLSAEISDKDIEAVREIFMSVGNVMVLDEKYLNIVTALSGSGPAFFALFVEAMIENSIKLGLGREIALELAVQTLSGTAKLLKTGMSPIKLMGMVTSPGGTTEAGLKEFKGKGLINIVKAAMDAAVKRAEELGRS
ncbi:MAG: pyrroline-5-carboxylate reductase [Nitrospiraceae bacterium]|nr:pyrroline-5-carboxylate reductase [Nitrospiraceae bacterium]